MGRNDRRILVACVLILSMAVRIPYLSHPSCVVFDEVHFGSFISHYIRGEFFYDIHPPLAKMILYGVGKATGYDGSFNFSAIRAPYNSSFIIPLRLTPAVMCSFVAPLAVATLLRQRVSRPISLLCGVLLALESTTITQSRLLLTDGILYFFVMLTIFATSLLGKHERWWVIALQAVSASCACCVKFTAAGLFVYIAYSHICLVRGRKRWFTELVLRGFAIAATFMFTLISLFALHVQLLPNSGPGDLYVRPDFRECSILVQTISLLVRVARGAVSLVGEHNYSSKWYTWPFDLDKPMLLWRDNDKRLLLLSNPVSSLASTVGFIMGIFSGDPGYSIGYAASLFPFMLVNRVTFRYHYDISLMFGIMSVGSSVNRVCPRDTHKPICCIFLTLAVLCYLYYFNWVYGTAPLF